MVVTNSAQISSLPTFSYAVMVKLNFATSVSVVSLAPKEMPIHLSAPHIIWLLNELPANPTPSPQTSGPSVCHYSKSLSIVSLSQPTAQKCNPARD